MVVYWLCLAILAGNALASGVLKAKEQVQHPRFWLKRDRAPASHNLDLKIGLPQPSFHILERHLYEVSDPDHERYGQYLAKQDVEKLVAPHDTSVDAVDAWLLSHGIDTAQVDRSPAQDWVTITVPVFKAEAMLGTEFYAWTHVESGETVIRTLGYSLPEEVYDHVDFIQPTTMFARMKKQRTSFRWSAHQDVAPQPTNKSIELSNGVTVDASCNTTVTVSCLKQLYNAVGVNGTANNGNGIGITGYLQQHASVKDLQLFYADERPDALGSTFNFVSIAGGTNPQNVSDAGVEADLDTQFAFGITFPTNATFYSTGGEPPFIPDIGTPTDTNEPYSNWLDFILKQEVLPLTISTSYGDDEQTVPASFARRVCNGFAQLGARGVTLTFSSGDGGVGDGDADPSTQQCFTNDGKNTTRFLPGFPASCPYVTAVGGTITIPEVAVSFSGGGFSDLFQRPSYQDKVVTSYLNSLAPGTYQGLFNPNGRAYPDVSALADNFKIFFQGNAGLIGGTSASAPTFAAFVSLLNDVRIANGQPSLGFLNPFLYSKGFAGLNDITVGNNPGCGTQGFNATVGWDPVTGFGTPDFGKLKDLILTGQLSDKYRNTTNNETILNASQFSSISGISSGASPTPSSAVSGSSSAAGSRTTSPPNSGSSSSSDHGSVSSSSTPAGTPASYIGGPGSGASPASQGNNDHPMTTQPSSPGAESSLYIPADVHPSAMSEGMFSSASSASGISATGSPGIGSAQAPNSGDVSSGSNSDSQLDTTSGANPGPTSSPPSNDLVNGNASPTVQQDTSSQTSPDAVSSKTAIGTPSSQSDIRPTGLNAGGKNPWCKTKRGKLRRRRKEEL